MSDIVERILKFIDAVDGTELIFRAGTTPLMAEAAAEITRLRAELADLQQTNAEQATIIIDYDQQLAEARDKALDEAASVCETHMKQFLDDNDVRKMWPATQARNDVYAGLIRALKSPKPPII